MVVFLVGKFVLGVDLESVVVFGNEVVDEVMWEFGCVVDVKIDEMGVVEVGEVVFGVGLEVVVVGLD